MEDERQMVQDLRSPIKSFRLMAAEKCLSMPVTALLQETLTACIKEESDEECLLLLRHAVSRMEQGNGACEDIRDYQGLFHNSAPLEKLQMLTGLREQNKEALAPTAWDIFQTEAHPAVKAVLIRNFGKYWPDEHLRTLANRLGAFGLGARLGVLELLVQRAPKHLEQLLPRYLISEDPRLRTLAIEGLARLDLNEALLHLEEALMNGAVAHRFAALQTCLLLPFARIRETLLKYLTAETDVALVKKAGLLFRINPDVEVPFRLWELLTACAGEKAAAVREIIQGACQAIEASRLLKDGFPRYQQQLQEWIHRRAAVQFVQDCLSRLSEEAGESAQVAEGPEAGEVAKALRRNLEKPFFRETLRDCLQWPISEVARTFVCRVLTLAEAVPAFTTQTSPPGPVPVQTPIATSAAIPASLGPFQALAPEDQILRLSSWEGESQDALAKDLKEVFAQKNAFVQVQSAALRSLRRLEISGFQEEAFLALKSPDAPLVGAALEYLGWADFDRILPFLGKYLRHANPRLKTAAMKILKREDPRQAVSSLMVMLKSRQLEERVSAQNCLVHFDFTLIRDELTAAILEHRHSDLIQAGLCLFEANPAPENLYKLFCLQKGLAPQATPLCQRVSNRTKTLLVSFGRLSEKDLEALEAGHQTLWEQEEAKRTAVPARYSVKRLQASWSDEIAYSWKQLPKGVLVAALGVILATAGIWWNSDSENPVAMINKGGQTQPILAQPYQVNGIIQEIDTGSGIVKLRTPDGTVFRLPYDEVRGIFPFKGMPVSLKIIPIYAAPDGEIIGRPETPFN